jgi:hypothetical protein
MVDPECDPARLTDAYKATRYVILYGDGELCLRVGERSWAVDQLLASHGTQTAAFITAWNPHSCATAERENMEANRRLQADLLKSSVTVFDGYGQGDDGKWPAEPSFLAVGITRRLNRQRISLASGRFAMIDDDGPGISLVPWTPSLERQLGRHVSGVARAGGIEWGFGKKRGLGIG